MNITEIIAILEAVISDIPTLVEVVTKLIDIYKSKEAPTEADWQEINALCDKTHQALQNEAKN